VTVPSPTPTTPTTPTTPVAAAEKTVWLCRPDRVPNPCTADLTASAVTATGVTHREPPPAKQPTDLDCFYVYPTVSEQSTSNANLAVEPAEASTATAQVARFSPVCRVWAPVYRQRTVSDLSNLGHAAADSAPNRVAFASVESAWRDYLAHDNHGRRVVFIGHSQGASMLIRLLRTDIDPVPALRAKTALALLIGGNVTVADGKLSGGSFQHIPLCTRPAQTGCVIAYSSFPKEPPTFTLFGRAGAGVSLLSGETAANRQVACVNPAAIGGGSAALHPYFPTNRVPGATVSTPWISEPGRYVARCRHRGVDTWLEVTATGGSNDVRPAVPENLGPAWGFHVADVNLALGDLVADVAAVAH
jgi:hypothetical protein